MSKLKIRIYSIILKILTKGIQEILFVQNMFYRHLNILNIDKDMLIFTLLGIFKKINECTKYGNTKIFSNSFFDSFRFLYKIGIVILLKFIEN